MERLLQIARDVAKGYAAIVKNDRAAMAAFAVLALVSPDLKANYGTAVLLFVWGAILAYWWLSNTPKSKRLDHTFHEFTDETGCYLLTD